MCSKKDKGLTNRIIEKYEQTCGTIDLCHCFNNICKYSLKKFPSELLQLVKKISSHFGSSSLRRANFREVQKDFREDEFSDFLKVLPYVSHRWSSLLKSAKRILCLWENLEVYFVQYNEKEFYSLMSQRIVYIWNCYPSSLTESTLQLSTLKVIIMNFLQSCQNSMKLLF